MNSPRVITWRSSKSRNGQKPHYSFEEINDTTLRVIRDNDGELFQRDFSLGHTFITYKGLPVEMIGLNPKASSDGDGYYLIVREINGAKKTDVSAANQIDKLYWDQYSDTTLNTDDLSEIDFIEGAEKLVSSKRYERDPKARKVCIKEYGYSCQICSFDFSKFYGLHGEGFIEVHHVTPLHQIKENYAVHPIRDLIPVCSNCHSMLHRSKVQLSIEDLKSLVRSAKK